MSCSLSFIEFIEALLCVNMLYESSEKLYEEAGKIFHHADEEGGSESLNHLISLL